jgi:hypothetical protein
MGQKMKKKLLILIFLMFLVWGINLYLHLQSQRKNIIYIPGSFPTTTTTAIQDVKIIISKKCNSDLDCSWQITNCCPEKAGAHWQCINANESVIKCIGNILCPQFISLKPNANCSCKQGECG